MSLQTPGLLCMQWYTSGTALVVAFLHGSYLKYQGPFKASPTRVLGEQAQLTYASYAKITPCSPSCTVSDSQSTQLGLIPRLPKRGITGTG